MGIENARSDSIRLLAEAGAKLHREEFGPGATIEARYGSGAGDIHLESFSGDAILVLE